MKALKFLAIFVISFVSVNTFAADDYLVDASPESVDGAKNVNNAEAKALFDKGALFVDVRSSKAYKKGRVPDSAFLDLKKNFTKESLGAEAGVEDPIVIYCQGPKCKRAAVAAKKAISWGYKDVYYYRLGFPGWKKEGYPVESD